MPRGPHPGWRIGLGRAPVLGARRHGLSSSTVVAACDLLQAQGRVEARAQPGFFVRNGAAPNALPSPPAPTRRAPPLDAAALVRSMFEHQGDRAPSPGMGTLGIHADATQIVTTAGATAALDLVPHPLLPGDSVLVEEPGWPLEYARLGQMGVTCLPVPRPARRR